LENRVDGETDNVCDMANRYYSFLNVGGADLDESGIDCGDPDRGMKAMSPGGLIMHRHPGRAMDTRKDSRGSVAGGSSTGDRERTNSDASTTTKKEELPEVHGCPKKGNGLHVAAAATTEDGRDTQCDKGY
jgi:hypothetical protein